MFPRIPKITQALMIANVVVFLLQQVLGDEALASMMLWPLGPNGLDLFSAGYEFKPWQLLTYGFMHGSFPHLAFNMLALYMFGAPLEYTWGDRRFLAYFLVCIVGAGLLQLVVGWWAVSQGGQPYPTVGASGGGPHALACAALDPQHVAAVVTLAGVAPFADEPWWFDGMASPGALESARDGGREGRRVYGETAEFDESSFVDTDWQALAEEWSPLGADAGRASAEATANGSVPWGEIDDDVAFTRDWGFDLAQVECPVLVMQGSRDRVIPRAHGEAIFPQLVGGEFWLRPRDGHVAVLRGLGVALDWVLEASSR